MRWPRASVSVSAALQNELTNRLWTLAFLPMFGLENKTSKRQKDDLMDGLLLTDVNLAENKYVGPEDNKENSREL